MAYAVYILRCADGTLYTGIATDIVRRVAEHNGEGTRGARYTSARRPVTLVYAAEWADRSAACKEEARIKRLSRHEKLALIATSAFDLQPSADAETTPGSVVSIAAI
jgi:putative endonuclease